ncbi:MAG: hypothetical protein ACAH83_07940 [Alphaproteobacteria bacterium]
MKKRIKLPVQFEMVHYAEQPSFKMSFSSEAIRDWCLGLSLLKEGLVESLVIEPTGGKLKLELQGAPPGTEGRIPGNLKNETVSLKLTPVDVDYLLVFSLKYYRDGYAKVDHIDLQSAFEDLGDDIYVTLKFADVAPPMSSEAAKKLLGH